MYLGLLMGIRHYLEQSSWPDSSKENFLHACGYEKDRTFLKRVYSQPETALLHGLTNGVAVWLAIRVHIKLQRGKNAQTASYTKAV